MINKIVKLLQISYLCAFGAFFNNGELISAKVLENTPKMVLNAPTSYDLEASFDYYYHNIDENVFALLYSDASLADLQTFTQSFSSDYYHYVTKYDFFADFSFTMEVISPDTTILQDSGTEYYLIGDRVGNYSTPNGVYKNLIFTFENKGFHDINIFFDFSLSSTSTILFNNTYYHNGVASFGRTASWFPKTSLKTISIAPNSKLVCDNITSTNSNNFLSNIYFDDLGINDNAFEEYNNGISAGYSIGNSEGYTSGYSIGNSVGNSEGFTSGYNQGQSDSFNFSWLIGIFTSFGAFFNITLFNNITIGGIILIPLMITLVTFIVGIMKGGGKE